MISIDEGFRIMYNFLCQYWEQVERTVKHSKGSFILLDVISTMNPGQTGGPKPLDPAKYTDWLDIINENFGDKREFSEQEIFSLIIKYLEFYEDYFGFYVKGVIEDLNFNICGKYKKMWVDALQKNLEKK